LDITSKKTLTSPGVVRHAAAAKLQH